MAKRKQQTTPIEARRPVRKQIVWSEFWKGFDEWYNGESWERQADMLIRMFSKYVGEKRAKRIMKVFDMYTKEVGGGEKLEDWKYQSRLFEDLLRIEVTYKDDTEE